MVELDERAVAQFPRIEVIVLDMVRTKLPPIAPVAS
jgi:hypothetical protein